MVSSFLVDRRQDRIKQVELHGASCRWSEDKPALKKGCGVLGVPKAQASAQEAYFVRVHGVFMPCFRVGS